MIRVIRSVWAIVILLFLILIPVQFYLAGHGAFEFHNTTSSGREAAWDPHRGLGDLLVLISLIQFLLASAARIPRRLLIQSAGLLVLMILQYILAQLGDSVSTRFLAAFHPVNGLLITGTVIGLLIGARPYLPIARLRPADRDGATARG